MTQEVIDEIVTTYRDGIESEHFSKFVNKEKIKEFEYRLNPVEYLDFDVLKKTFGETVMLKDIAEIHRGLNINKEDITEEYDEDSYLCLNIKDIDNGRINYDSASRFREVKKNG